MTYHASDVHLAKLVLVSVSFWSVFCLLLFLPFCSVIYACRDCFPGSDFGFQYSKPFMSTGSSMG